MNVPRAAALLLRGADVNTTDAQGVTPLIIACERGERDLAFYIKKMVVSASSTTATSHQAWAKAATFPRNRHGRQAWYGTELLRWSVPPSFSAVRSPGRGRDQVHLRPQKKSHPQKKNAACLYRSSALARTPQPPPIDITTIRRRVGWIVGGVLCWWLVLARLQRGAVLPSKNSRRDLFSLTVKCRRPGPFTIFPAARRDADFWRVQQEQPVVVCQYFFFVLNRDGGSVETNLCVWPSVGGRYLRLS